MKNLLIPFFCLLSFIHSPMTTAAQKATNSPLVLDWIDLIPENERTNSLPQNNTIPHQGEMQAQQSMVGTTRPELNNKLIKIPGFVIPLEGDDKVTTEFLLVPYFGACIHVPPPPPNQIIYVKFKEGAPLSELWDIVNVIGVVKTSLIDSGMGQAGYLLEGNKLEAYEDPMDIDVYEPK